MSNSLPCPQCQQPATQVTDSRARVNIRGQASVYRRRKCLSCEHKFSTVEDIRLLKVRDDWPLIEAIEKLPLAKRDLMVKLVKAIT